ncbi:MAG TPA: energy-coupling factor transporter transmembrane protein EcfT [Firmicutes bacterium]|nr:energy-coupling factor transporter transmembrane protein EcfT [Bacillota bacterium]
MLKDITIGQYIPGDSIIHRLDPRTKILAAIIFILALFIVTGLPGYTVMTVFSVIIILLSRIPARFVLRGLKPLYYILAFTVVLNFFLTPGRVIWSWWFLRLTQEGLRQGLFMGWRLLLLVLTTSLLTLTSSPIALTDGIERLLNPFRRLGVPAHELAMMMTIALRFIPTLLEETDKIMKAQMARGADFDTGNIIQRARGMVPLLVPLFISSFRRADELAMAMEARCYRGGEGRTRLKQLKMARRDYYTLVLMVAILAFAVGERLWL